MCGIAGYQSKIEFVTPLNEALLLMTHRGPDSFGVFERQFGPINVGAGHVRLKVIDLDERASQPFYASSGKSAAIFNGEIYNFKELKLLLPNTSWKTTSDTEVVAELLDIYGPEIVAKFNGIYAIANVCLVSGQLSLYRDPLGVKPLYYTEGSQGVFFASEIKALSCFPVDFSVSSDDLFESLNFGYIHEPRSGFEHIKKVQPGWSVIFDSGSGRTRYIGFDGGKSGFSDSSIQSAINRQSVSDVPLGIFFSGGLDSTVMASELDADLLYFEGRLGEGDGEERRLVKRIAQVFDRKLLIAHLPEDSDIDTLIKLVDDIVVGIEEPISDLTYRASAELAALARDNGYTVMLSGLGADEVFGGYLRYYVVKYSWIFNPLFRLYLILQKYFFRGSVHKTDRIDNYLSETKFVKKYARLVGYFSGEEINGLLGASEGETVSNRVFKRLEGISANETGTDNYLLMRKLEISGFLSHNLTVADKSSMASSIELRVPYLDLELFYDWMGSNAKLARTSLGKKALLKVLVGKLKFKWSPFLKTGFNPPIDRFLQKSDKDQLRKLIMGDAMKSMLDEKGLENLVDSMLAAEIVNYHKLWQLLFLSRWLNYWSKF